MKTPCSNHEMYNQSESYLETIQKTILHCEQYNYCAEKVVMHPSVYNVLREHNKALTGFDGIYNTIFGVDIEVDYKAPKDYIYVHPKL